ncbi:MAG: hypothetical protein WC947_01470 [Elusimicrobiota bacterium]
MKKKELVKKIHVKKIKNLIKNGDKSKKLIRLKKQLELVENDYQNPLREKIICQFFKELDKCNRWYYDDFINAVANELRGGQIFGEDTMISMLKNCKSIVEACGIIDEIFKQIDESDIVDTL